MQFAGAVSAPDSIEVTCRTGPPVRVAASSGLTCRIVTGDTRACTQLVQHFLACPAVELVPRSGGLLSNLSVLENVVLPVVYHGRTRGPDLTELVYDGFEACGVARAATDVLCQRPAHDLDEVERRLVAVVRSLLMRPGMLVMERIFEGLSEHEMERAVLFASCYRRVVADGTLVYLDVAGMPGPALAADVRAEAE